MPYDISSKMGIKPIYHIYYTILNCLKIKRIRHKKKTQQLLDLNYISHQYKKIPQRNYECKKQHCTNNRINNTVNFLLSSNLLSSGQTSRHILSKHLPDNTNVFFLQDLQNRHLLHVSFDL